MPVGDRPLPLLALDIGTRKVAGLLTVPGAKGLEIQAVEWMEHTTRAMYDGQIHDVGAVADVVRQVVDRLAAQTGVPITEAAVAAAGRSLRTATGTAGRSFSGLNSLTREDVLGLELEAVQNAQAAMASEHALEEYHYVGHSVMGQRLDGVALSKLEGQRGRQAEVDVIATFLPRTVVDSLEAVLDAVGLKMRTLTLEPIAALGVVVPPSMRHLNLVLVDIGAGTSDLAVTRKGAVVAYDMVPVAGDEITEALSEAYLLDFPTGERVKRQISRRRQITLQNILGQRQTVSREELTAALTPAVERLASLIADRVILLNGGPPQAVLLVGGGSLTPGLAEALARALGMPADRVAVRGRSAIGGVEGARALLKGPDAVTPIGIAVSGWDRSSLGFAIVHVAGRTVRLFQPRNATAADALLAAGYRMRDLYGPMGQGLTITVNGSLRMVPGSAGTPAHIRLNGADATLETPVHHGDRLELEPGLRGAPGAATVAEVAPEALSCLRVEVCGDKHVLAPRVLVNGRPAAPEQPLKDNDQVEVLPVRTIHDVMLRLGLRETSAKPVCVTVNGQAHAFPSAPLRLCRNGCPASPDDAVEDGDQITLEPDGSGPIFADLLADLPLVQVPPTDKCRLVMRLNGSTADFTTPLRDGDAAEVTWEEKRRDILGE